MGAGARVDEGEHRPASVAPDSIRRNTAFALLTQFTTSALTAALTLYLVRALGPKGYGTFALAIAVAGLLDVPSDLGISSSAARFIAERRGDRLAVARVVAITLRLKLVLGAGMAIALFALAGPIASAYASSALAWPLRGAAIALFFQSMFLATMGFFTALGRIAFNLRLVFAEGAIETTTSVAFVALGGGAAGAAFGRAIGYCIAAALALAVVIRLLGRRAIVAQPRSRSETRQLVRYAGVMVIVGGAFQIFSQIDQLLIGAFLSAGSVGLFSAPLRLTTFLGYLGAAISAGVAPRLARSAGEVPNVQAFLQGARLVAIVQAAITAAIIPWARPIVDVVLGRGYGESAIVLQALGPYIYLLGFGPLVSIATNYLGEARRRIPVAISTVVVNLVIDLILIPRIGIVAGAIGTSAAYALYAPAHLLIVRRALAFPLRPIALSIARSLAAGAAAAGVLAMFGTSRLTPVDWTAGSVAGLATFVAVLLLTREVSTRELLLVGAFAHRLFER